MTRPLTLQQAAMLTMGWEPMPGLVGALRDMPLRHQEFRRREAAIKEAYGSASLPSLGPDLPRRVSLRHALEFAQAQGWSVHKRSADTLARLQRIDVALTAAKPADAAPTTGRRPAHDAKLVEIPESTVATAYEGLGGRSDQRGEAQPTRLEKTLLRSLGALAVVVQEIGLNGTGARFIKGKRLSVSALADYVAATVAEADGAGGVIPGYTPRTMQQHISNALDEYYRAKRDLFDVEEGASPAE